MNEKKLTQEELLKWLEDNLNRACMLQASHPHLAWTPTQADNQVYTQIKEIVEEHFRWSDMKPSDYEKGKIDTQQKPTVTREWAKECWDEIMEYHIDKGFSGESIFIQRLKEAGVEVIE